MKTEVVLFGIKSCNHRFASLVARPAEWHTMDTTETHDALAILSRKLAKNYKTVSKHKKNQYFLFGVVSFIIYNQVWRQLWKDVAPYNFNSLTSFCHSYACFNGYTSIIHTTCSLISIEQFAWNLPIGCEVWSTRQKNSLRISKTQDRNSHETALFRLSALRDHLPDSVVLRQDSPGSTLDYPWCLVNLTHSWLSRLSVMLDCLRFKVFQGAWASMLRKAGESNERGEY